MKNTLTLFRIVGFSFLFLFGVQFMNVFLEWFPISPFWMKTSLFAGLILLLFLALSERYANKEDHYYSKNVEK